INGIDTKKFSKDIDFSDIKEEFSLKDDAYRILYVSRMDASRSAVAYMVASAMPGILKVKENAELVIVGDGDDFARLKAHTDKINSSLGREVIKLTGARVDINKFVAASDAFVGVSRSALEAMAAGLPVIIAGNEGYIGIFGEDKFKVSYDTNYCCRGSEEATDEVVLRDLLKIVASTDDEIEKMSLYNKSVIEKYYSAKAMAKDYDDMYKTLLPLKHFKAGEIIINGYYGYGNIGDDALLQAIVENAKRLYPDAKITVLSSNPKQTAIRYTVRSIHRYNIPRIINEMKGARLFISGGGSLLQDVTSTKSLVYYTYLLRLAKKHGLITSVYANGFGPITRAKNLEKVKKVLSEVDFITLREPASAEAVRALIGREVKVSADPAFALSGVNDKWKARLLLKFGIEEDKKYFALSLRSWSKNDKDVVEKIQKYVNAVHEKYGYFPLFVAMQPSKDLPILNEIKEGLSFDTKIVSEVTARELISILEKMEFSVGMRLHFLIFSAVAGVLPIALSYDPKINSLMEYIGLDTSVSSSDIDLDELFKITARAIEEKVKFSELLSEKVSEMKNLTLGDTLLIKE
ncbi:MAG: polysaccharide pyruvyl transferase CsaB, partial [Clostridia bacterium]|nr:polysaccharide pyruvyl transferase CsaB [Clostridia bacterium]